MHTAFHSMYQLMLDPNYYFKMLFDPPSALFKRKYQLYVHYVHLKHCIQHVYSDLSIFFIGCVTLKYLNLEDVLYIHKLNNDHFTVGLHFVLSRKCGRYFNDSQAEHNCEVIVSSSGQLFSICVNWDRLRRRDRILMQKANFSILSLLGSFLTKLY